MFRSVDVWDAFLLRLGTALLVTVLLGLAVRRRLTRLPSFTVYLVSLACWQGFTLAWPDSYTLTNWAAFEALAVLTTLWIALELATRIAGRMPGARRVLGGWLLAILGATAAFVAMAPVDPTQAGWPRFLAFSLLPRLNVGIAACFCAVAGTAALYAVPLDRLHRSALLGLMLYILFFVVVLDRLHVSWLDRAWLSRLNALSYTGLVCTWVVAAWQPGEVLAPVPLRLKRLWWPWAPAA
jgi:hypothetical protein